VTATGSELQTLGQVHRPDGNPAAGGLHPVVQHLGDPFPSAIPAGQPLGPSMGRAKTEDDGAEHNGSERLVRQPDESGQGCQHQVSPTCI
jgi:hypothetical protein